ncbi:MAG: hypothetical protein NVS9B12_01470 [Vulcanimicrobiaceae bacterium]
MHAAMHAVITAGGRVSGELAAAMGTQVKALAKVAGRTMLERAVAAARIAGAKKIAVIGGSEVRAAIATTVEVVVAEGQTGAENVHLALSIFSGETLLYLSSDLPFISGQAVTAFVARVPPEALAMPLAEAGAYERRFPGSPEHATVIGGERIANGSVFVIPPGAAPRLDRVARKLFVARKNLPGMAVLLGPQLLLKFALKRLRIADIERKAAALLGCPAYAIRDCNPELCFDVDTLEDYRYATLHG